MSAPPPRPLRLLVLALGLLLAACSRPEGESPAPVDAAPADPAGTVLAVEAQAITLADVEEAVPWIERIAPSSTAPQLLRLGLTQFALPRAIARALAEPGERERALEAAQARLAAVRAGEVPADGAPGGQLLEGGFKELGLHVWGLALDLPEGAWSEIHEGPGHFVFFRRLATLPGPVPMAMQFRVDALTFPYMEASDAAARIEAAYDRLRLRIVDPQWREIVPELLQHRMRARPLPGRTDG